MMGASFVIDESVTVLQQEIVAQYGLTIAAVLARIQLYAQKADGVCTASMETIGNDLHLDRATTSRHAQKLCEEGYLEDLDPNLRNHPHRYRDTGKARLVISMFGQSGVAKSNTGVAENNTGKNKPIRGVANYNTSSKNGVANYNTEPAGVAENNTNGAGVAKSNMTTVVVVKDSLTINKLTQQQQADRNALVRASVSSKQAEAFVRTLSTERINLALDVYAFMRFHRKARGSGYLIDFLEEDWQPPAEYIPADRRCSECWRALDDHAETCSKRGSDLAASWGLCPKCLTSPCTCDEEEEGS